MPVDNWEGQLISAEEFDRLEAMYHPLAHAVRQLIDATVRTGADEPTIRAAAEAIDAVTESLKPLSDDGWQALRHAETGRPILFTNPAAGGRNPVAPPMVIHHEPDGRCWSEFTLGAAYEGPPGLAHGGISALVLDHLLGEAASGGLVKPRFTGTITLKYLRGTPLGPLRAEAFIEREEERKTYARGFISDAQGPTVEAEGVFIKPAWAEDSE
ncbi:MAG TPA: PaaI family thioesterase [Mycobacterium sp.]|uniref:PaaI family thioesterase n=1 Tax=Mycolicibacterium sp. TaxID=2320850 RepID=UPI0025F08B13|nr:PaaI family thioesterase [Mycolicibacterium sp.]HPX35447.1 PaaI family thioesterase [Mycobacterium sp.]HQC75383.1 PaaI family thioesterase [Mycobacterium sp.]